MNNQFGNALDTVIMTPTNETAHHLDEPLTSTELPYVLPQHLNREVFEKRRDGELMPDEMCQIMIDCQKKTYGDGLDEIYTLVIHCIYFLSVCAYIKNQRS